MNIEYTKTSSQKTTTLGDFAIGDVVRIEGELHIVTDERRSGSAGERLCCTLDGGILYGYSDDQEATAVDARIVVEGSEDDE